LDEIITDMKEFSTLAPENSGGPNGGSTIIINMCFDESENGCNWWELRKLGTHEKCSPENNSLPIATHTQRY
jgi:hypothetical protein